MKDEKTAEYARQAERLVDSLKIAFSYIMVAFFGLVVLTIFKELFLGGLEGALFRPTELIALMGALMSLTLVGNVFDLAVAEFESDDVLKTVFSMGIIGAVVNLFSSARQLGPVEAAEFLPGFGSYGLIIAASALSLLMLKYVED